MLHVISPHPPPHRPLMHPQSHPLLPSFPSYLAAGQSLNMVMEQNEKNKKTKLISKELFLLFPDMKYATSYWSNTDINIT